MKCVSNQVKIGVKLNKIIELNVIC